MAPTRIAAIGECMLELSGQGGQSWRMGFAGDTLNTLWALKALNPDSEANYVSAFGDDPFSRDQIAFFADNGIGIGSSPVIAGARPGLYAITLHGAERSFTYWRSDSAARQLASDTDALAKSLENQALLYFSGITLAILDAPSRNVLIDAIGNARRAGSLVAFDPNYRPRLWKTPDEARSSFDGCARRGRHRAADLSGRAGAVRRRLRRKPRPIASPLPASARSWSRTARTPLSCGRARQAK